MSSSSASPTPRRARADGGHDAHPLLLAALVVGLGTGAGGVAATGLLNGEPVENPRGFTPSPSKGVGIPNASAVRLTGLRVADPDGGPPWGLRTLRTTRGVGCVTVGRVVGDQLGVLGTDGAFGDDGRFHPRPAGVIDPLACQPLDAKGNSFVAISHQGLPASGSSEGCLVQARDQLPASAPESARRRLESTPVCDRRRLRIVYYGTLGPRARSVTYETADGRLVTAPTSGPQGAYLVVLRPDRRWRAQGTIIPSESPGSGLRSVRYRDGSTCRIRSPRALGGARRCPRVGFVAPGGPAPTAAEIRSPVTARFAPGPVRPTNPGAPADEVPAAWELTVSFTARRATTDASAYYVISLRLPGGRRCAGQTIGPVSRNVAAGERVTEKQFVPRACRGRVEGTVTFHTAGETAGPLPFAGFDPDDPIVGRFAARIPR